MASTYDKATKNITKNLPKTEFDMKFVNYII